MSKKSSRKIKNMYNDRWHSYYLNTLKIFTYQLIEWEGLPKSINPFFLEKTLHENGLVAFYNDPVRGWLCVRGTPMHINMYDEPVDFRSSMINYNKTFQLKTYVDSIETSIEKNYGLLLYNQFGTALSSLNTIDIFARLLADNKHILKVAQNTLKVPYVFQGSEEQVLAIKNFFDKLDSNEPLIITEKDSELLDSFKLSTTNVNNNFILNDLYINRMEMLNEFLTDMGTDNLNINKRERLVVAEAESNNQLIINNQNKFLTPRKAIAEYLTEYTKQKVTVKYRCLDTSQLGGFEYGTLHSDNS